MSNFFTSPKERAGASLWDAASSGHPVGEFLVNEATNKAKKSLMLNTSNMIGGVSGDINSQLASQGVSPGDASAGLVSKAKESILGQSEAGMIQLDAQGQSQLAQMLIQQLMAGYDSMSSSSTFGDLMAGLTTAVNLGSGVAIGGGSTGMNWWGKK